MANWTQYVCATLFTMLKPACLSEILSKMEILFPETTIVKTRDKVVGAILNNDLLKPQESRLFKVFQRDDNILWAAVAEKATTIVERMILEFKDSNIISKFLEEIKISQPNAYQELISTQKSSLVKSRTARSTSLIASNHKSSKRRSSTPTATSSTLILPVVNPPTAKTSNTVQALQSDKSKVTSTPPFSSVSVHQQSKSVQSVVVPSTSSPAPTSSTVQTPSDIPPIIQRLLGAPAQASNSSSESSGVNPEGGAPATLSCRINIDNKYFKTLENLVNELIECINGGVNTSEKLEELTACIQEAKIFTECAIDERDNLIDKLKQEIKATRSVLGRFPVWSQKIVGEATAGRKYQVFPTLRTCTVRAECQAAAIEEVINSVPCVIKVLQAENSVFIETSCMCEGEGKCKAVDIGNKLKRKKIEYSISHISKPRLKVFHSTEIPSEVIIDEIHSQFLSDTDKPKIITEYTTTGNRKCTIFECDKVSRSKIAGKVVKVEGTPIPILDSILLKLCTNCGGIGHFKKECNKPSAIWSPNIGSCNFCRDNNQHHPFSTSCPRIQRAIAAKLSNINYGAKTGEHVLLWKWPRNQRDNERGAVEDARTQHPTGPSERSSSGSHSASGSENSHHYKKPEAPKIFGKGRRSYASTKRAYDQI